MASVHLSIFTNDRQCCSSLLLHFILIRPIAEVLHGYNRVQSIIILFLHSQREGEYDRSLTLSDVVIIALFASHAQTATILHHMHWSGSATLSHDVFLQLLQLTVYHS